MEYRTTYRRTSVLIPSIVALLLAYIGAAVLAAITLQGSATMTALLWLSGAVLALTLLVTLNAYRRHVWTIVPGGLSIRETPRIPLTGFSRRAEVRFPDIVRAHRIENGLDRYFDIYTRDGRRFRLAQAMKSTPEAPVGRPDPDAPLEPFVAQILSSAFLGGAPLPKPREGFGFFNSIPGIAFLGFLLVLSVALAGLTIWAILDGADVTIHRSGNMGGAGIVFVLPFGLAWMLRASLRRRREVLARRSLP